MGQNLRLTNYDSQILIMTTFIKSHKDPSFGPAGVSSDIVPVRRPCPAVAIKPHLNSQSLHRHPALPLKNFQSFKIFELTNKNYENYCYLFIKVLRVIMSHYESL